MDMRLVGSRSRKTDTRGDHLLRRFGVSILLAAALGCTHTNELRGPPAPKAIRVSRIVVTPLGPDGSTQTIRDRARIKAIAASFAFSESAWTAADDRDLAPAYRIEFHGDSPSTYWLGVYPPPVSVPLYFYSTWWISPSTRAGQIDRTRIKGLADTVKFRLFGDLGL
jgi:hypothetical protein